MKLLQTVGKLLTQLAKNLNCVFCLFVFARVRRAWQRPREGVCSEEDHPAGVEWGATSRTAHDHYPLRASLQQSPDQETAAHLLGDLAENFPGRETAP